jgi:hypothetical protein
MRRFRAGSEMRLGLVGKQPRHGQDERILKALYSAKGRDCPGPKLLIAFRNEQGQLYRFASLDGPAQELELRRRLAALDLLQTAAGEPVLTVLGKI